MRFTSKNILTLSLLLLSSCLKEKPTDPGDEEEVELTSEEIKQLQTGIVRKILDDNGMQSRATEDFVQYVGPHIVSLDLSGTQIAILHDSLGELERLTTLLLDDLFLPALPDSIVKLSNLRTLSLRNSYLDSLPDSLHFLTSLERLYLNRNNLEKLPQTLGLLANLKELDLEENFLAELPDSLDSLDKLESLILNRNLIDSLPEALGNLTALRTLEFNFNQIRTLPQSMTQLRQLVTLKFAGNRIAQFPDGMAQITSLAFLVMDQNQFTQLPSFSQLANLQLLSLADNQLILLPGGLDTLRVLKELYIQNNRITSLPLRFGELVKLNTFIASQNGITELPYSFSGLGDLQTLNLQNNRLTALPQSITQMTGLEVIWLSNNPQLCALSESQRIFLEARTGTAFSLCPDSIRADTVYQNPGNNDVIRGAVYLDTLPFPGAEIFIFNPYQVPLVNQPSVFTNSEGVWEIPLPVGEYLAAAFFLEESTLTPFSTCYSSFVVSSSAQDTLTLPGHPQITSQAKSCNAYIPYPGTNFNTRLTGLVDTQVTITLVDYPLDSLEAARVISSVCGIADSLVQLADSGSRWVMQTGRSADDGGNTYWQYAYSVSQLESNPQVLCTVSDDTVDNDGDGCIDEEIPDGIDNDLDGFIDEDTRITSYNTEVILLNSLIHPDSLSGDTVTLDPGGILSFSTDSAFWVPNGNSPETRQAILQLSIPPAAASPNLDSALNTIGGCWSLYPQIF